MGIKSGVATSLVADGRKSTKAAVSVGTEAEVILAANEDRRACLIQPTDGDIYIGDSTVLTTTGIKVASGTVFTDAYTQDVWYAISGGSVDVRVLEVE